jgi:thiol:disulfide interchange protein DsbC
MIKSLFLAAALIGASQVARADDPEKAARDALHTLAPSAKPDLIRKSELPGFYEILVNGEMLYVSADGKYLLRGEVYDVPGKTSLSGRSLAAWRYAGLKDLPVEKRIVFSPPNPKHTITVFTDVDCPYCRKFHQNIAAINQQGIAVQYVFFPLSIHPGADKKAQSVWCSQDRNAAYTAAMNGQDPGTKTCANPIAETLALALKIGINATPTILAADGTQIGNSANDPKSLRAELDRIDKTPVAAK